MNKTLMFINLFLLVASVLLATFMKKLFEEYTDSPPDSQPMKLAEPDIEERVMMTGETYPVSAALNDPFRGATCSASCCGIRGTSFSCDKGCICRSPEIQKMFKNSYM